MYAVWELAYTRPRINTLTAARAKLVENVDDGTTSYEMNEEGTYALVTLEYACDKTLKEIKIECRYGTNVIDTVSITDGTRVITDVEIGDGELDPERTYTIKVTVTDEVDYNTSFFTLSGINLPFDVLMDSETGPKGASFGKPAELEGKADFNYEIYPRKGFSNILLEPETDLNNVMTPNTYIGENTSSYNYGNCPIEEGTFTLEVAAGGKGGQRVQTLTSCRKDDFVIWKRFYYTNAWGDWIMEYSGGGKLLASPGYYMNSNQTVEFTAGQTISQQANGIVLAFSLYEDGTPRNYEWVECFVSKYTVMKHIGMGHCFNLCGPWRNATKYLYIHDGYIVGHEDNVADKTVGGISYTNKAYVLRYVIGV